MSHSHSHQDHSHNHHEHSHNHNEGILGKIGEILHLPGFSHEHEALATDFDALNNELGIRTIWIAFFILGITTVLQIVIYFASQSVALLADTVHNLGDALNSLPLLLAFYLARRLATRRYSYGFGRAEDIAGIFIVASIVFSAAYIFWESFQKFLNPQPLSNLAWLVAASLIGFLGNELVAIMQIRVGNQIGSAAMVADGQHARTDGLTSLAVLIAAAGTWLGFPIIDPIIGIVIGIAILAITWSASKTVWYRLMDAVEPSLLTRMEHFAGETHGVEKVLNLRARWIGHKLATEITIQVDDKLSLVESYSIAEKIRQVLKQAIPHLGAISIDFVPRYIKQKEANSAEKLTKLLPPRYLNMTVSAAPMGAAGLKLDKAGEVAWDEIWTDFCDLALAGGPPHRGTLLEPVSLAEIEANPEGYEKTLKELERGLKMVTGLKVIPSQSAGWIGLECTSEEMALWLLRAIVVENISVRREGTILYFPAGANFQIDKEIKNVITVVAKTYHYWKEHMAESSK
jgi:cation diffusion facilitator family transporter